MRPDVIIGAIVRRPALSVGIVMALLIVGRAEAAFEIKPVGAPSVALGGAASANASGVWSAAGNPAGLGFCDGIELASFYARPYSLKALSHAGTAAVFRLPVGGLGFSYSQFGESPYQEKEAAVSFAFALSPKVQIGGAARGYFLAIDDFGSARAAGFDVGVASLLRPGARLALLARNVNRPAIGRAQIPLPTGISAGGAFQLVHGVELFAEVQAVEPEPILFKSGLEFSLSERFFLRGGLRTRAMQFAGGFGCRLGAVRLDYAYQHSLRLPGSHHLSVELKWARGRH